jgi:hypothetical protein
MIMDQGRRDWPNPIPDNNPLKDLIPLSPRPVDLPTKEEIEEFRKLLEQAKKFDAVTGQPDCEDPAKTVWLKGFCNRLREKSEEFAKMADELEAVLNET